MTKGKPVWGEGARSEEWARQQAACFSFTIPLAPNQAVENGSCDRWVRVLGVKVCEAGIRPGLELEVPPWRARGFHFEVTTHVIERLAGEASLAAGLPFLQLVPGARTARQGHCFWDRITPILDYAALRPTAMLFKTQAASLV